MKRIISLFLLCLACASCFAQVPANNTTTLLASATYTAATINSPDQINYNFRGCHVIIQVTTATTGNYTPHIQGLDPVTGLYYDILVGAAISTTGTTVLKVYPGIATIANGAASDLLPAKWRVQMIGASTPSMIFSVSANLEL